MRACEVALVTRAKARVDAAVLDAGIFGFFIRRRRDDPRAAKPGEARGGEARGSDTVGV